MRRPSDLAGVPVGGATHDALFVTTTYGKTIAIDAKTGAILWTYTPPDYQSWAGSAQVTNSTPVADPDRQFIYAALPDGHIQKLAVTDGHAAWSTSITLLPQKEKVASPLSYYNGHIIGVTGGYIGDAPPYQGHVAILDAASGKLLHVWNSLCSDRTGIIAPSDCPESGSAIWGRAGAVIDSATGDIDVATGNGRWDGKTYWGDAVLRLDSNATQMLGNYTPSNSNALADADADIGSASPALVGHDIVTSRQGRQDQTSQRSQHDGRSAAFGRRAAVRRDTIRQPRLHRRHRAAKRVRRDGVRHGQRRHHSMDGEQRQDLPAMAEP